MKDEQLIPIHSGGIIRVLGALALLLLAASLAGQVAKYRFGFDHWFLVGMFDISREGNFPTYFSVLLLLICSSLMAVLAGRCRLEGDPDAMKWGILALGFLVMSYDEAFQLHELIIAPTRDLLGDRASGLLFYAWILPALIMVGGLGLFFLRFLLRLPGATRVRLIIAAVLYLGGSLGVEVLGGRYDELHGHENLTYNLISTLEEGLELSGLIVCAHALLRHIRHSFAQVGFRILG